jgi:hypothetical protein
MKTFAEMGPGSDNKKLNREKRGRFSRNIK